MTKFVSILGLTAAILVTGCAKKEQSTAAKAEGAAASPAEASKAAPASEGATVFEVTANDQMKFGTTRLEVKAGATVRIVLNNVGTIPKVAMGHNIVVLKLGVDPLQYALAAAGAQATDYLPAARSGDVIAHTKLIGPKEKDEITFTAPSEPGEYPYICTFPGHFAAGMKGVLVVQ